MKKIVFALLAFGVMCGALTQTHAVFASNTLPYENARDNEVKLKEKSTPQTEESLPRRKKENKKDINKDRRLPERKKNKKPEGRDVLPDNAPKSPLSLSTLEGYYLMATAQTAEDDKAKDSEASDQRDKIQNMIKEMESVEDCVVISYGDSIAIAIKTKGVVLASQDRKLRMNIEDKIRKDYPVYNNVFVLTRVKDYYALKGLETKLKEGANPLDIYKAMIDIYKNQDSLLPQPRERHKKNH